MNKEELELMHTAFWAGVEAIRNEDNLIRAYFNMLAEIEEKRNWNDKEEEM